MEDARFDSLARTLSRVGTRRGTLAGLAGGLLLPLLAADPMAAKARRHDDGVHGENWRHKKCPHGLTKCTFKKGNKKKYRCVDMQTDPANCGACRNVCPQGKACGGGGTPGVCGCTPTTCAAEGKNCGDIPDGCGNSLNCGTCDGGNETCGGDGTSNVCGCRADGFIFPFEEGNFNCDPCCSGDCCFESPGFAVCAGGCG